MEWFGVTKYGASDPIKDMMRSDYEEPTVQKDLFEAWKAGLLKGSFVEWIKEIDIYIGQADGYAYKSYDRLLRMRNKGTFKPVGPTEMYRYRGCSSMATSWFLDDDALKKETWHNTRNPYRY
ncbi:PREDICTED: uncharacterized protein LOC108561316 [Nicrophorus vespilloides]|uniref:Uncharacterized protein LOC108561316 n=1 Tax=Nicrophorus vespilloides TaxID=110193 RepID=A0ABM1MJC6_NICVS|nr:PREDICTED: uncharacterized protein LOC108561316 [Nicrophorus vespilloides]